VTIRDVFRAQAQNCVALGSPFMGRLMKLLADRLEPGTDVTDRIFGWTGNPAASADNVPLRLGGALHALKLEGLALRDVYPPHDVDDDTLWNGVAGAMVAHGPRILAWLDNPPQTNEVRRAAVILPALALLQQRHALPVELLELGTSGGLNLRADRFRLNLPGASLGPADASVVLEPDWTGAPPPEKLPHVIHRAGVDLSPIDPATAAGRLKLLAYLWADQPDRIARTKAAIAEAKRTPASIAKGDAGDWLEQKSSTPAPDRLRVVFHTIAWQYFPDATRARVTAALESAGGTGPLAHLSMEYDGGDGAAVTLTTWPGGKSETLARADFHGRWIKWSSGGIGI
jgi:hypothetical protein